MTFTLKDLLPRALFCEYADADVGELWYALPEADKDRWRRVAAYVERLAEPDPEAQP